MLAMGCSSLSGDANGVVALQLRTPVLPILEVGDTLQLSAQAVDENGDSVVVPIRWRTPDTTIALDSVTGRVTNRVGAGSGRVQATYAGFTTDFATFTIVPRADTLVVRPDTLVVLVDSTLSPPLDALDSSFTVGTQAGRRLTYLVTSPTDGSVALNGGVQVLGVTTSGAGVPIPSVTLTRVVRPSPTLATVEVRSYRPSGLLVPGSGQQIAVRFEN
jgi:hypothetical protein